MFSIYSVICYYNQAGTVSLISDRRKETLRYIVERRVKNMVIKILGSGCKNCVMLKENTETALKEAGINAEIIKVTDFRDIVAYGVMSTPALVVDEKVVSFGKVLKPEEIVTILKKIG